MKLDMKLAALTPVLTAIILQASAGLAHGQCTNQTLAPAALASGDIYGTSIATKGNVLVVGAPGDDNAEGSNAGTVYVHTKNAGGVWGNSPQVLLPLDLGLNSAFGQSVAIDNQIIVGANTGPFNMSSGTGAAYIYALGANGQWALQKKLVSPDPAAGDAFGCSVAIRGDWAAVGAYGDSNNGFNNNGAVYLFKKAGSDWVFMTKLTPLLTGFGHFGEHISMGGAGLMVQGYATVNGVEAAGAVWVYTETGLNTWSLVQKINSPYPADNGRFGAAISASGNTLAIGGYFVDLPGPVSPSGVTAMYEWNGSQYALTSAIEGSGLTGASVAVNGDTMVVGDLEWYGWYVSHLYHRAAPGSGQWIAKGSWHRSPGNTFYNDHVLAMTSSEIFMGLGSMEGNATTDSGRVEIVPITASIAADQWEDRPTVGLGTYEACTALATADGTTDCGTSNTTPDVWYSYTPTSNLALIIDTLGSAYDTVLSVHGQSRYTSLACNDDAVGRTSRIVFPGKIGETIAIRVSGYNGAVGEYTLNIAETCPADFDNDGTVDFFDYDAFVTCFEGGVCPEGRTADFDGDTTVDFFDYDSFVVAFEAGC
ncbi:MAG: FG-GAP repeat protein [Planctomycetota bacterium]